MNIKSLIIPIFAFISTNIFAGNFESREKILLFPFNSIGIDTISLKTAENLCGRKIFYYIL